MQYCQQKKQIGHKDYFRRRNRTKVLLSKKREDNKNIRSPSQYSSQIRLFLGDISCLVELNFDRAEEVLYYKLNEYSSQQQRYFDKHTRRDHWVGLVFTHYWSLAFKYGAKKKVLRSKRV